MKRYLAIRVERPRRGFATILRLRKQGTGHRGFTPLSPKQDSADVRFYQIDQKRRRQRAKPLQTVRIDDLKRSIRGRDTLTIQARYDGARTVAVEITEGGSLRERVTLSVEREPSRPWWLLIAIVLFAILLGFGLRAWMHRYGDTVETEVAEVAVPAREPIDRDSDGRDIGETDVRESDAMETESAPNDSSRNESPGDGGSGGESPATPSVDNATDETEGTGRPDSAIVESYATIYFLPNSVELTEAARLEIVSLARQLPVESGSSVSIVGHAAPYGSEAGRSDISRGRALTVYEALRSGGWQPSVEPRLEWRGASQPVTIDRGRQNLNRRVEIRFSGD